MGQGQLKSAPQVTIPVTRILRHGRHFMCGHCRRPYASLEMAHSCLTQCVAIYLAEDNVIQIKGASRPYRCRYCLRDYKERNDATGCGRECRTTIKKKHVAAQTANNFDAANCPQFNIPPPPRTIMQTPGRAKLKVVPTADEEKAMADANEAAAKAAALTAAPVEEVKKKKRDLTKRWYRDGAKYVCEECGVKYFTKEEVEKCFNAHPQ